MSQRQALSFLSAADPDYIAGLYEKYAKNPSSIDQSWADLFQELGDEAADLLGDLKGASWKPEAYKLAAVLSSAANGDADGAKTAGKKDKAAAAVTADDARLAIRALMLIRGYRVQGHFLANLDPLGLSEKNKHADLELSL